MNIANLKSKSPTATIVAVAALAVFLALAWLEHDAHLHSEGALREIQKQSAAEISGLRAKADVEVREANQTNARALSELETSCRLLEHQSQNLRQRLASLEGTEKAQVQQVAALPVQEVAKRLGDQLGPGAIGQEESGVRSGEIRNQKSEWVNHSTLKSLKSTQHGRRAN